MGLQDIHILPSWLSSAPLHKSSKQKKGPIRSAEVLAAALTSMPQIKVHLCSARRMLVEKSWPSSLQIQVVKTALKHASTVSYYNAQKKNQTFGLAEWHS